MKSTFIILQLLLTVAVFGQDSLETVKLKKPRMVKLFSYSSEPIIGYLHEMKKDSMVLAINGEEMVTSYTDIDFIKMRTSGDKNRSIKGLYGAAAGALPGIFYTTLGLMLNSVSGDDEYGVRTIGIIYSGVLFTAGGAIIGGGLGYILGKPDIMQMPIQGSRTSYKEQKEKVKKLGLGL
jgi:hypothetical protein